MTITGKREKEILDYMAGQGGSARHVDILVTFAPQVRKAKDRVYVLYSIVERRLERMEKKGLVRIEERGKPNRRVYPL